MCLVSGAPRDELHSRFNVVQTTDPILLLHDGRQRNASLLTGRSGGANHGVLESPRFTLSTGMRVTAVTSAAGAPPTWRASVTTPDAERAATPG